MIRPFAPGDLDRILEIEQQAFPKSPYPPPTFLHLHRLYPNTFWVHVGPDKAEGEREIFGYIVFSTGGHLLSLAIHPNHRRRGIATTLIRRALHALSGKKLWAEVRQSNQGALAFYLKVGFQIVGVLFNYYGGEDALLIEWIPPCPLKL
jgi:ribosomal-protein-alanine N-acetyltransferase